MNIQTIQFPLFAAGQDDGKGLEVLKKALTDNGFKHTFVAAQIMLNEMEDLPEDASMYYQKLALKLEEITL